MAAQLSRGGQGGRQAAFACADVGVACRTVTTAPGQEELLAKVADHARTAHGVELNDTLLDYALTRVRGADQAPPSRGPVGA